MKSRINISYDIEENGAIAKKSLPLSVGIIGDFCGNNSPYSNTPIEDRDFIPINRDTFATVMNQLSPGLSFSVDSILHKDKSLKLNLKFHCIEDFKPISVIKQIPALSKILELRNQLKELQSSVNTISNESIEKIYHLYKEAINEL